MEDHDAHDRRWIELALDEARRAADEDEVPIGAVVVRAGELVASARNRTRAACDPTAHAELLALSAAARALGAQRLTGCTLYSTVEPCFMCAGACSHARLERVVYSVRDPKFGACASLGAVLDHPGLNHQVAWSEGVGAEQARELLRAFFRTKRASRARP